MTIAIIVTLGSAGHTTFEDVFIYCLQTGYLIIIDHCIYVTTLTNFAQMSQQSKSCNIS